MLREDVRDAAGKGEFHIYAYDTVDQAIELLTGISAGEVDDQGEFPEGSINRLVHDRLADLEEIKEKAKAGKDEDEKEKDSEKEDDKDKKKPTTSDD